MISGLTEDLFLGGKVNILQPVKGYRAGVDPVMLAASVPATPGQRVLDLGCGVGTAALCLAARVPDLGITGVEVQPEYADLAVRNGAGRLEVFIADLSDLPATLLQRQFDHVIANPPYYDPDSRRAGRDRGREAAIGERTPLSTWVKVAAKRLAPKGQAHFIHRAERLPDLLSAMAPLLGSLEVLPIVPRAARLTDRVIVRARKNGRAAFKLHPPLVMHSGPSHLRDGDSFMPQVAAVLRDGAALPF
ncbi:MAG: methyltransferase [Pseudomonadota bacterium]